MQIIDVQYARGSSACEDRGRQKSLAGYRPPRKKFAHKFLFGADFPGVSGIRNNYEQVKTSSGMMLPWN
jgi:hypothetical protein